MTSKQIIYVRSLLRKAQIDEDEKRELVMHLTNDRTDSLKAMTHEETQLLVEALGGGDKDRQPMVRKILSMAHTMGWEHADGSVNLNRVNAWCRKYTKHHCDLDALTYEQLPEVVTIFGKANADFLENF